MAVPWHIRDDVIAAIFSKGCAETVHEPADGRNGRAHAEREGRRDRRTTGKSKVFMQLLPTVLSSVKQQPNGRCGFPNETV